MTDAKNQTPETEMDEPVPSGTSNLGGVVFEFPEHQVSDDEMAPVRDVLQAGEEEAQQAAEIAAATVTPEQIATFLRVAYEAHGVFTGMPQIWRHDESWYLHIAQGIVGHINAGIARYPMMGHAIRTVDAAGTWGEFAWDYCLRWVMTIQAKRKEKAESQTEEVQSNGQYQSAPAIVGHASAGADARRFIIP
ncbi:hypothetical protein SD51_12135 [Alicyclobacillus tengchongensis]|nr:hypothetical protein SD51_12135 [Alicyclobacillus tengchongensis]